MQKPTRYLEVVFFVNFYGFLKASNPFDFLVLSGLFLFSIDRVKMDLDFTNKKVLVTGAGKGTIFGFCLLICQYLNEFSNSIYYEKPLSPHDESK